MNYYNPNPLLHFTLLAFLLLGNGCKKQLQPSDSEAKKVLTHEKLIEVNRILVEKDQQRIAGWVNLKGWEMVESPTGLWYKIDKQGGGILARDKQIAVINFKVELLDGTVCYSSDKSGPKTFKIGHGGVESGLEEAILLLHVGDKATFIMPPHLAYGLPGDGDKIPARSILVYQVELLELK